MFSNINIYIYMHIQIATYLKNRPTLCCLFHPTTCWTPKSIQDVLASKAAAEAWLGGASSIANNQKQWLSVKEVFPCKKNIQTFIVATFPPCFLGKKAFLAKKVCVCFKKVMAVCRGLLKMPCFLKVGSILSFRFSFQGWNLLDHWAKA